MPFTPTKGKDVIKRNKDEDDNNETKSSSDVDGEAFHASSLEAFGQAHKSRRKSEKKTDKAERFFRGGQREIDAMTQPPEGFWRRLMRRVLGR
jgi:predicted metal-dependent peptidase